MQPLVSILIPTYNGELYLKEALQSANSQTYSNCEIIISDDASIDKTLEIARKFKEISRFEITIVKHQPNGIGKNWNNCVKIAKGSYLKFLFQDDILFPNCIEKMVNLALEDTDIGLVYCKRKIIDVNNDYDSWIKTYGSLHTFWKNIDLKKKSIWGTTYLKDENLLHFPDNKIGEPTAVLLKKEVFDTVGFFRTGLYQLLDIEFWYRVMKQHKIAFIDEELIGFRLHDNQATKKNSLNRKNDYHDFYHILYHEYFNFLNIKVRWKLLWGVTKLRKITAFFKRIK